MIADYEFVEEILNNIFASRLKTVSSKNIGIWVREISDKKYSIDVLKKSEKYIIDNDDVPLTISSVCRVMNDYRKELSLKLPMSENVPICPICSNSGITQFVLKFDSYGLLVSNNYALSCVCGYKSTLLGLAQMQKNDLNNKTETKDGYFRIFDHWSKFEFYQKQLENNQNKDLKVDFGSLEFKNYQKSLGIVVQN